MSGPKLEMHDTPGEMPMQALNGFEIRTQHAFNGAANDGGLQQADDMFASSPHDSSDLASELSATQSPNLG